MFTIQRSNKYILFLVVQSLFVSIDFVSPNGTVEFLKQGPLLGTQVPCTTWVQRKSAVSVQGLITGQVHGSHLPTEKPAVSATVGILTDYRTTGPKTLSL